MLAAPAPPLRHQQLIVTIYGLYGRSSGDALPVSVLISMLGTLGYDAPGVRSSVSRLKAKGVLKSVQRSGVAQYELSGTVVDVFREGDQRIFAPQRATPSDAWVMAIFSVPESLRSRRHQLRSELSAMGFGCVASGVWIAPDQILNRARERLASQGLMEYVDLFRSDYLVDGPMEPKIAKWWDLKAIDEQFGEFLDLYDGAGEIWSGLVGNDPEAAVAESTAELRRYAFQFYVPMLTVWRRFPYRDPNLPLEYLPEMWRGPRVRQTFEAIHRFSAPLAAAFAQELIESRTLVSL